MNTRRSFLSQMLKAGVAAMVLPAATTYVRANLVIASMADEQAALTKAALSVTTQATLEYLMKNPVDGYPVPK